MNVLQRTLADLLAASSLMFLLAMHQEPVVANSAIVPGILAALALPRLFPALARGFARRFLSREVMIIGSGKEAAMARELAENSNGRFHVGAAISAEDCGKCASGVPYITELARKRGIKHLVLAFSERRGTMPAVEIMRCRMRGLSVMDLPGFYERATRKLYIENLTPGWFIFSPGFRVSVTRLAVKRLCDIVLALLGLAVALPFLPLFALILRFDSPGPVFFRQMRCGLDGRPFLLTKLRSMRSDAEKGTGAVWASSNDVRVTKFGRFLRKTRIDEIPQLANVLMGDMSIVGPRPERPEFVGKLERRIPFYYERHFVKPGVTGWAQVRYPYGASVRDALEKLRYDLYYIKNQSLMLDMEIILRTAAVVFTGKGAR